MAAVKQNLTIEQGRTFSQGLRWEEEPYVYVPISAITKAGPVRITTAAPHGLVDGWRAAVVSALGMTQINAENDPPLDAEFRRVTVVDPTTVEFNALNSSGFDAYVSGGYLQFFTPVDLTGYTARMSIKDKVGGIELFSLTDTNGRVVIDNAAKSIRLAIQATDTGALTWKRGVYDLEMVSPTGDVFALFTGSVTVTPEITT